MAVWILALITPILFVVLLLSFDLKLIHKALSVFLLIRRIFCYSTVLFGLTTCMIQHS